MIPCGCHTLLLGLGAGIIGYQNLLKSTQSGRLDAGLLV